MRMDDANAQVAAYLQQHETKGLLRFITCGSVDDGKSTLIGRLLHDTKSVSYTHLDVYKRQVAGRKTGPRRGVAGGQTQRRNRRHPRCADGPRLRLAGAPFGILHAAGIAAISVSYTHLDVYKRQECGCHCSRWFSA